MLSDEYGAPPGLGGMGGDHRRNQSALQGIGDSARIQLREVEFCVCGSQAAVLRRLAGGDVNGAATLPVDVFGNVGQQREMAERPDYRDRHVDVDAVEHARHLGPIDLRVPHLEGLHPRAFDEFEYLVAVLLAHSVAEDGAQQSDVGAHRLSRFTTDAGPLDGPNRLQCGIGNLNHAS